MRANLRRAHLIKVFQENINQYLLEKKIHEEEIESIKISTFFGES